MWIVRIALDRPYTFVVLALLILIASPVVIARTPTDIFPAINIPVIAVAWQYSGLNTEELEGRIITSYERVLTTTVDNIQRIESTTVNGQAIIKVYLQPNARLDTANAQITAISQTVLRQYPPGIGPPLIINFSASSVPILQLALSGEGLAEQQLFDLGVNFLRPQLVTIPGVAIPYPFGGKQRQVMVDLNTRMLQAKGLAPNDVLNTINLQNLILPSGTAKIGQFEYYVNLNASPRTVPELADLPIKVVGNSTIYLRDVANVRDGFSVQTNIVRRDGRRGTLLTVLKAGDASTLDVVDNIRAAIPRVATTLPPELKVDLLADQSIFVRGAISGVIHEAIIAACLTALMILLFLGSWRSTLIIAVSIPLSILTSVIVLSFLRETINIMTLGGLALAVGILVDDATVEIENIHRNLGMRKPIIRAILDGAQQIAVPAFVSTLCICIVFVPVVFLEGAVRFLFTPLALAVVLAMMASYFLSRTLVPTMVHFLLASEVDRYAEGEHGTGPGLFWAIHGAFNRRFERMREWYRRALGWSLAHRATVLVAFALFFLLSLGLAFFTGEDFFPAVDAGQLRLHVRAPAGTRIEETDRIFGQVAEAIRRVIPDEEISRIINNVGIPLGSSNLAYSEGATIGPADGEMLISLRPDHQGSTFDYMKAIRRQVYPQFPELTFFFQSADIVSQTLNFGLQSPIDLQVVGNNRVANFDIARRLADRVKAVPGLVDVRVHQVVAAPQLRVEVDRVRAAQIGMTQRDVANNLLVSLASSSDAAPNFWLNPQNGVSYRVSVQTPQYRIDSLDALTSEPMVASGVPVPELLTNLAQVERGTTLSVANHYNIQNVFDVYANVQDRDLGGAARDVRRVMAAMEKDLPRGTSLVLRGQVQNMDSAFQGLASGLVFAVILVYALMVVNFQSWLDPFIIITALPGALSGILLALFVTQTTINVPSLMGAIMSIGVATSNSILLVTFANDQRKEQGLDATAAALSAGYIRLRPVLMTALAMIIGMLPMALGLGEGAEQNAPLGRAVIGGLALATVATLFVVPVIYSLLRRRPPFAAGELHPELAEPGVAPARPGPQEAH